ncbi:MAG: hypothetical protein IJV80_04245 [Clostridia bacterium]|nr:hypothetical protein [Clostridia bacterium]
MKKGANGLKTECLAFLRGHGLWTLRPVARYIGVESPTKKKKGELVNEIAAILCGEKQPVERTNLGAPIKNDFFDPEIVQKLEEIRARYALSEQPISAQETVENPVDLNALRSPEEKKNVIFVADSSSQYANKTSSAAVYVGQLETVNGVSSLFNLNGKPAQDKVVVTVEQIRFYDLRDGDVIACHAERRLGVLVLSEMLELNGAPYKKSARAKFDSLKGIYPTERISFEEDELSITEKYLEWFLPMGKGQRCLVSASLKSGKTFFLKELCKSLVKQGETEVFALLIDQAPESSEEFLSILPRENFVCTSFEETDAEHVFAAEFLLKRAKRRAETGKDVFVIVDSLSALAKCYESAYAANEPKTAGGISAQTVRFIKKYFGSARNFEQGGSLGLACACTTMASDSSFGTLYGELSSAANMIISLDSSLAARRIFPAISLTDSRMERSDLLFDEETAERERFFRSQYLPVCGEERLHKLVEDSETLSKLYACAINELGKN